jgi:hypothetical protein
MPYYPTQSEEHAEKLGDMISTLQFMQGRSALLDQVTRELNEIVCDVEAGAARKLLAHKITKVYELAKGYRK